MSGLYISQHEVSAIKAIDACEVERRVQQSLDEGRPTALSGLNLWSSGSHIANHLHRYERDLANYAKAKAARKRSETRSRAWSSGNELVYAIRDMKRLVDEQEREIQFFRIDDLISPPYRFRDRVEVRIYYQWRTEAGSDWRSGTITFFHDVDMRPDYTRPQPTRKPSAAKLEEQRQDTLLRHWDHLRMLALQSVRQFFKAGGDGSTIPDVFEAKPSRTDRHLNNLSCDFWGKSDAIRKFERAHPPAIAADNPTDECSADGRLNLHGRVRHAKFGEGVITYVKYDRITADFGEIGSKTVMASFLAPLKE